MKPVAIRGQSRRHLKMLVQLLKLFLFFLEYVLFYNGSPSRERLPIYERLQRSQWPKTTKFLIELRWQFLKRQYENKWQQSKYKLRQELIFFYLSFQFFFISCGTKVTVCDFQFRFISYQLLQPLCFMLVQAIFVNDYVNVYVNDYHVNENQSNVYANCGVSGAIHDYREHDPSQNHSNGQYHESDLTLFLQKILQLKTQPSLTNLLRETLQYLYHFQASLIKCLKIKEVCA